MSVIEETAEMVAELRIPGVTSIHGVSHDGVALWFVDGAQNRLARVDPSTGTVDRTLSGFPVDAGTAFDGTHLWQVGGDGIRRIDRTTGNVLATLPLPEGDETTSGLAWAEGHLWAGSYGGKKVYKIDPASGAVVKTLRSDRFVTGITWSEGELWHGSVGGKPTEGSPAAELRRIDPESGEVERRLRLPPDSFCSGTEADGAGRIWYGDPVAGTLRAVRVR